MKTDLISQGLKESLGGNISKFMRGINIKKRMLNFSDVALVNRSIIEGTDKAR